MPGNRATPRRREPLTPQVSQQEAERSKYVVLKAEQERKAAVIRAEGEAEAAKLISTATRTSPALVELRRIEARASLRRGPP